MAETFKHTGYSNTSRFQEEDMDVDIRSLFLMLWRRRYLLVAVLLLGLGVAFTLLHFIAPRYAAHTLFMIDEGGMDKAMGQEMQNLMTAFQTDTAMILSELEVVRSRSLARKVVKRLNLVNDPEFNERLKGLQVLGSNSFKALNLDEGVVRSLPPEMVEVELEAVVTEFVEHMRARSIPGSNVLQVEFTSVDPVKAALITNTIADVYIRQRLEEKFASSKKLADWLDKRLSALRKQVQESAAAVEEYKMRHNLSEGVRATASAEQVSQLNTQLVLAKAQRAEAEARFQQIRDLADNPASIEAAAEIVNSNLIHRLKLEKSRMEGELSDLSSRYGYKHPEIKKRQAGLVDIKQQLKMEMAKIADSLKNEVGVAKARQAALEESLFEIENVRHRENQAMIRLRELVREAESNRLIYDTFLNTYKRSDQQEALQEAEAKVISYAAIPQLPVYPNKVLFISLSAAISLFLGLAISLILEKLDNSFRSAGQLEQGLGLPCFALLPQVKKANQVEIAHHVLSNPSSTAAEAVRTLRMMMSLRASKEEGKPKIVTVTSSFPGEGKTTLSTWLARLAAKSGEKVILVDCDLRRPNVHSTLGKQNDNSIVEYLTGKKELNDIIRKDDPSGMHVIYGRSVPNSALDLVSSSKMEKLIASLGHAYDLVVLDSPACLAVSDARVLAKYSDHAVYAVGWNKTPREVVASGVKQFRDMNYTSMSMVLTGVDFKRHIKYGYGDTVYYYGHYAQKQAA